MAIRKTTRKSMEVVMVKKQRKMSNTMSISSLLIFVLFGFFFGYFLSKSRATDYDSIIDMFMVKDFQLYGVIGTAVLVVAAGLFLASRYKMETFSGKALDWQPLKFDPKRLIGAFIFGAGWALAGTCPGTVVTQLGEGKVYAIATILGILGGVWTYAKWKPKDSDGSQC
jgi:uncharacterized membrane protein YedE/YeeE